MAIVQCTFTSVVTTPSKGMDYSGKSDELFAKRKEIVQYAQQQIGSKYKYAGRDPKGFDCSGFTHFVMKKYDVSLPTSSSAQSTQGKKIALKEVKTGDLIFFKRPTENRIFHVAMVVENDQKGIKVIHSTSSRGVREDNISTSSYWKPKIYFAKDVISK